MITKTIKCFLNKKSFDDRDHYKNKRIDTAGDLLSFLFKQLYKKLHKDMTTAAQKNYEQNRIMNISQLIKSNKNKKGQKRISILLMPDFLLDIPDYNLPM